MFQQIWQFLKRFIQRLLGTQPPPSTSATPRTLRSDTEYEAILMELLEQIETGWGRGDIAGFLIIKSVKDAELAAWLRQKGETWLATDEVATATDDPLLNSVDSQLASAETKVTESDRARHSSVASLQKLARRLILLSGMRSGELGQVSGEIGRQILAKYPPPPPPEEDWHGQVIEAVFVGDGLGNSL